MNLNGVRFHLSAYRISQVDTGWLDDDDGGFEGQIVESIGTDLNVKIGGVEMHLGAWLDPEHWEEDWARALRRELGDDFDVEAEVEALLEKGREEGVAAKAEYEREKEANRETARILRSLSAFGSSWPYAGHAEDMLERFETGWPNREDQQEADRVFREIALEKAKTVEAVA